MGAGMRPPRAMKASAFSLPTGIMGARPKSPPNSTSPSSLPGAGMTRTAVVLLLMTPMAASSAMMADMVEALVLPGTAIISSPTLHTEVMASSLSRESAPRFTASIMPMSSLTGMKAPDSPPTCELAMVPPFFTASLSMARHAVVPCAPTAESPISSSTSPTLSLRMGVGARERSTMPKEAPSSRAASLPTSSPMRVILKEVFFMVSDRTSQLSPRILSSAAFTTPGPDMPTFTTQSPSLTPLKEPAIKGLSSTAFANTTSFAQPSPSLSAVSSAVRFTTSPMRRTASILMPARVEPTLTLAHTRSVEASTSGMVRMNASSSRVIAFWTRAV